MNILLLTHYFWPEVGAPQARLAEMPAYWASQGHDVTILTGFPNHPTGVIPPEYRGKAFMEERRDGYRIRRHWLYATPNKGFIKRTMGHCSLAATVALRNMVRHPKPDIIVASSPTFFILHAAWFLSKVHRVPWIAEIRDLWPGIFVDLGVLTNKRIISFLEAQEMFFYRSADRVVTVTQGFKDDISGRGIDPARIEVITNGVDTSAYKPGPPPEGMRAELGLPEDAFIPLYIGAHGISQAIPNIVETAALCTGNPKLHFLFVGEGAAKQESMDLAKRKGLENVTFLPAQPREKVIDFYRMADCCLIPLRNVPLFDTFIPSKMFEIMAAGRPIVASLKGESAGILERSGAAAIVPPENPRALADCLIHLANDSGKLAAMAQAGPDFATGNYDRNVLAGRYLELMQQVVERRP